MSSSDSHLSPPAPTTLPSVYEEHRCDLEKLDAVFKHHQFEFDEDEDAAGLSEGTSSERSGGDVESEERSTSSPSSGPRSTHRTNRRIRNHRHSGRQHQPARLTNTNVTLKFLVSCCKTLVRSNKYLLERVCDEGRLNAEEGELPHPQSMGVPLPPSQRRSPSPRGTNSQGMGRRVGALESTVDGLQRGREELADCTRRVDVLWAALSLVGDSLGSSSPPADGHPRPPQPTPVELLAARLLTGGSLQGEDRDDTPAFRVAIETSDRLGDVERVTGAQLTYLDRSVSEVKDLLMGIQRTVDQEIPLQRDRASEQQAHIVSGMMLRRDDYFQDVSQRVEMAVDASLKEVIGRVAALESSSNVAAANDGRVSNNNHPIGPIGGDRDVINREWERRSSEVVPGGVPFEQDMANLEGNFDKLRMANAAYASHVDVELKTLRSELKTVTGMSVTWNSVISSNEAIKAKMASIERRHTALEKHRSDDVRAIVEEVVRGRLVEVTDAVRALYKLLDLPSIGECIALSTVTERLTSLQTQGQLVDEIKVNNFFTTTPEPSQSSLHHVTFKEGSNMALDPNVGKGARDYFDNKLSSPASGSHRYEGLVSDDISSNGITNPAKAIRDQNRRVLDFVHKAAPFHVLVSAIRYLGEQVASQGAAIGRLSSSSPYTPAPPAAVLNGGVPHPSHRQTTPPRTTVALANSTSRAANLKQTFGYESRDAKGAVAPASSSRPAPLSSSTTPAVVMGDGVVGLRGITVVPAVDSDDDLSPPSSHRQHHRQHQHHPSRQR